MIARKTVAIDQRLPAPPPEQHAEAEQPQPQQRPVQGLPERLAHHLARPVRPDPADLRRHEAGVFERLFGDVVPELFAAHPRQRLVAFQSRVGVRGEPRQDLLQPQLPGRARPEDLRVFGDHRRPDPFRVPVRGQVGPRIEHLPAAGRDRHHPFQRHHVPHRPGQDHDHDPEEHQATPQPAPAAIAPSAPARRRGRALFAMRRQSSATRGGWRGSPAGPRPRGTRGGPG